MKYLIRFCLILLLVPVPGTRAQNNPLDQVGPDCCSKYKIGIVTPPKDIDYKLIIIVPPKDFDLAMVINPCLQSSELSAPPKVLTPNSEKKVEPLFKLPPFPIQKDKGSVVHFWN